MKETEQENRMIQAFSRLPEFIINEIVSYDDVIRYRNGRWINRILKTDPRKTLIKSIAKPKVYNNSWGNFVNNNCFIIKLGKHNGFHLYHLHFYPDKTVVYICDRIECEINSVTVHR